MWETKEEDIIDEETGSNKQGIVVAGIIRQTQPQPLPVNVAEQ